MVKVSNLLWSHLSNSLDNYLGDKVSPKLKIYLMDKVHRKLRDQLGILDVKLATDLHKRNGDK